MVALVKNGTITPFYQLLLPDGQEHKKTCLSIGMGCGTWGCNGFNQEAHSESVSLDRSAGQKGLSKEPTVPP